MADYSAIADASDSLVNVIQQEMLADPSLAPKFAGAGSITQAAPVDSPQDLGGAVLSVYLYRILEDPYLKNQLPIAGTGGRIRRAPLTLDLFYLITPLLKEARDQHIILGKVMQILHDRPTIEGSDLTGSMANGDDHIRAIFNPVSLEEAARVWQALETPYQLSICYTLRVVIVDSTREHFLQRVLDQQGSYAGK